MRESFSWSNATKVAPTNDDGTPTLYYAWVHIRDKAEALNLKKLYIHVLTSPLFNDELDKFGWRSHPDVTAGGNPWGSGLLKGA
jgi:hypothetical protein